MEEVLLDTMYELPSRTDVARVVIDEAVVRENVIPALIPIQDLGASEAQERSAETHPYHSPNPGLAVGKASQPLTSSPDFHTWVTRSGLPQMEWSSSGLASSAMTSAA